jgi:hypothetical protein
MYDSVHIYSLHPTNGATFASSSYQLVNGNILNKYLAIGPRTTYAYASGKLSEILYERFVINPPRLTPYKKQMFYYNTNGQLTNDLLLAYNGNGWGTTDWIRLSYGQYGISSGEHLMSIGGKLDVFSVAIYVYNGGLLAEINGT